MTSAEHGELVFVLYAVGASGVVVPPMFLFPRFIFGIIIIGGPLRYIGGANKSGWMNEDLYVNFIKKVPQVIGHVPVFIINKTDIAAF